MNDSNKELDEDLDEDLDKAFIIGFLMFILNREKDKIYFCSGNSKILIDFEFKEKLKKLYEIDCMGYDGNIFFTCDDKKIVDKFYNYFHYDNNNKIFVNESILNGSAKFKKNVLKGLTVFGNKFSEDYYNEDEIKVIKKLVEGTDCDFSYENKCYTLNIKNYEDFNCKFHIEKCDIGVEFIYFS